MAKQRVLLVGVSSGLGLMVAERMAEQDAELYLSAPELGALKPLEAKGAHLLEMDVTSEASVESAVATMVAEQGGIDCVFSNPGLHVSGAVEVVPQETVDRLFDVNVMGAARVLRAVAPVMRQQRQGRMIFTSSVVAHVSLPMAGWYASTKHALRAILTAFRYEVQELGIEIVMIEPGQINTGFDQASIERLRALDHPADYQPFVDGYAEAMLRQLESAPDAVGTADVIVSAIVGSDAKPVIRSTPDAKRLPVLSQILPTAWLDSIMQKNFRKRG